MRVRAANTTRSLLIRVSASFHVTAWDMTGEAVCMLHISSAEEGRKFNKGMLHSNYALARARSIWVQPKLGHLASSRVNNANIVVDRASENISSMLMNCWFSDVDSWQCRYLNMPANCCSSDC